MSAIRILGVIPARGGSKGLPGKNILPLAGLPLVAHAIRFAQSCPEIDRCIVSTDSPEIAEVARAHGGEAPFFRPAELATDQAAAMPVLQHALLQMERSTSSTFDAVLTLQPTNPVREHEDLVRAIDLLNSDASADGVIAVCRPDFNPRYVCVEEREGYMVPAFGDKSYTRRQDVPEVFRITGSLYLWRREYIVKCFPNQVARRKMLRVPEDRAIDIDVLRDLQLAELLISSGLVKLPWVSKTPAQQG